MVWFKRKILSTHKVAIILSKCLIKSLLLVTASEEKCSSKVLQRYPKPWDNFQKIQICFINLLHLSKTLMQSFYPLLRQKWTTEVVNKEGKYYSQLVKCTQVCSSNFTDLEEMMEWINLYFFNQYLSRFWLCKCLII